MPERVEYVSAIDDSLDSIENAINMAESIDDLRAIGLRLVTVMRTMVGDLRHEEN